jgi:UTP-glucose-1-phosphate uridylyltransferase
MQETGAITKTRPDKNNEYQLTDSIKIMIEEKRVLCKRELGKHR